MISALWKTQSRKNGLVHLKILDYFYVLWKIFCKHDNRNLFNQKPPKKSPRQKPRLRKRMRFSFNPVIISQLRLNDFISRSWGNDFVCEQVRRQSYVTSDLSQRRWWHLTKHILDIAGFHWIEHLLVAPAMATRWHALLNCALISSPINGYQATCPIVPPPCYQSNQWIPGNMSHCAASLLSAQSMDTRQHVPSCRVLVISPSNGCGRHVPLSRILVSSSSNGYWATCLFESRPCKLPRQ